MAHSRPSRENGSMRARTGAADHDGSDAAILAALTALKGMELSEFRMSASAVRLDFFGDGLGATSYAITIENEFFDLTRPGRDSWTRHLWNDDAVAIALLSTLNNHLVAIGVTGGRLELGFAHGLQVRIDPDPQYESWQVNSSDGLLLVSGPEGRLSFWSARPSLSEG